MPRSVQSYVLSNFVFYRNSSFICTCWYVCQWAYQYIISRGVWSIVAATCINAAHKDLFQKFWKIPIFIPLAIPFLKPQNMGHTILSCGAGARLLLKGNKIMESSWGILYYNTPSRFSEWNQKFFQKNFTDIRSVNMNAAELILFRWIFTNFAENFLMLLTLNFVPYVDVPYSTHCQHSTHWHSIPQLLTYYIIANLLLGCPMSYVASQL